MFWADFIVKFVTHVPPRLLFLTKSCSYLLASSTWDCRQPLWCMQFCGGVGLDPGAQAAAEVGNLSVRQSSLLGKDC